MSHTLFHPVFQTKGGTVPKHATMNTRLPDVDVERSVGGSDGTFTLHRWWNTWNIWEHLEHLGTLFFLPFRRQNFWCGEDHGECSRVEMEQVFPLSQSLIFLTISQGERENRGGWLQCYCRDGFSTESVYGLLGSFKSPLFPPFSSAAERRRLFEPLRDGK